MLRRVSGNALTFRTMLRKILREYERTSNDPSLSGNGAQVCMCLRVHASDVFLCVDQESVAVADSPVWMDSSTSPQCQYLESTLGGATTLADITGSRAYEVIIPEIPTLFFFLYFLYSIVFYFFFFPPAILSLFRRTLFSLSLSLSLYLSISIYLSLSL